MTQKTKAQLATDLAANMPNNNTGAITPAVMRTHLTNMSDSYVAETLFDAGTFLYATSDNTPVAKTVPQTQALLKAPVPLFDHFTDVGNVTTGEDDLYSDTIAAGQLAVNGDKIRGYYGGIWAAHATATRQMRAYFGDTLVFDTSAYASTTGGTFAFNFELVRVSASAVRAVFFGAAPPYSAVSPLPTSFSLYTEVTGLTLANTQVLKITGEAAAVGAATNDIIAKQGYVSYIPAA